MAIPGTLQKLMKASPEDIAAIQKDLPEVARLLKERDRLLGLAEACQAEIDTILEKMAKAPLANKRINLGDGRRPSGPSVAEMAAEALQGEDEGLTAAQVKDRILAKYPHRDREGFYIQVYVALVRGRRFKRLRTRKFVLLKGAGAKS